MLAILYFIGLLLAFRASYRSYGEEMCEQFPKLELDQHTFITIVAVFSAVFSWISLMYFIYRHKNFINGK